MVTFAIILAILIIILVIIGFIALVVLAVGGVGLGVIVFLFGDILVGIALTVLLIRAITKKK